MSPARVLVVDDSATMRGMISAVLNSDPEVNVVGQCGDALQARAAIKELNPDVVTLDIEMPNMSGLEFLEKIMTLRPMPVIMVSSLTQRGADATIAALEIGAFDCIGKPVPGDMRPFHELIDKVKAAAKSAAGYRYTRKPAAPPAPPANTNAAPEYRVGRKVVAIGSSTGGVEALIEVLKRFPVNCPPTVITQHMPATFTKSFAERLNRLCAPQVQEATDGARLEIGRIYLAPGGERHLTIANPHAPCCRLVDKPPVNGHRPSVDMLFDSVAELAGRNAVGVILTGMGRDGASGLLKMRHAGARTVGQNEKTCIVYGMPRVAFELGAVENQLPLNGIGEEILKLTAARKEGSD
jgi:two-component system chemotaxis response regulator CheB